MFEFHVEVFLKFVPKFIMKDFNYKFDFSEEKVKLFKASSIITNNKNDENFKEEYSKFFCINKYDSRNYIHFKFEFGKFCNYYGITSEKYHKMKDECENFFPFPLIGDILIIDNDKEIKCQFKSRVLNDGMFILVYPENDEYMLKYTSQHSCEFILLKDLTPEEKQHYKNYLWNYRMNKGYLEFAPFSDGFW